MLAAALAPTNVNYFISLLILSRGDSDFEIESVEFILYVNAKI